MLSRGDRREDIFRDENWIQVDRLLGEHRIEADTPAARREFQRRMEPRRAQETDGKELARLRWSAAELRQRRRSDPEKLRIAAQLRRAFAAPERLRPRRRGTTPCLPVGG